MCTTRRMTRELLDRFPMLMPRGKDLVQVKADVHMPLRENAGKSQLTELALELSIPDTPVRSRRI